MRFLTTAVKEWLPMAEQIPQLMLYAALSNRCKEISIKEQG